MEERHCCRERLSVTLVLKNETNRYIYIYIYRFRGYDESSVLNISI